jgi:hypothetical protein
MPRVAKVVAGMTALTKFWQYSTLFFYLSKVKLLMGVADKQRLRKVLHTLL